MNRNTGRGTIYGAEKEHPIWAYRSKIVHEATKKMRGVEKFKEPILSINFRFAFVGTPRKTKPNPIKPHIKRPDLDNLIKGVMDALSDSGVVWKDDAVVWRYGSMIKIEGEPSDPARTIITIEEG